jgi:hypothetical protein
MAFGITGEAAGRKFEASIDHAESTIAGMDESSISRINIYAHGAPGMIGDWNAGLLEHMLKKKMRALGQIHLLGCSTAGVKGHAWNPLGGWGLILRTAMYSWQDDGSPELDWTQNLARDLSMRISGVYVLGLSGISFPLSRVFFFMEGYAPKALMADRWVYFNGAVSALP